MLNKKVLAAMTGIAILAGAQSAFAGTAPAGVADYDIQLIGSCTAGAFGSSFGSYAMSSADLFGAPAGGIDVTCDPGVAYRIMVDGGMWGGGPNPRLMLEASTGAPMEYHLFDGATGQPVGDANPLDSAYMPVFMPYDMANGIDGIGTGGPNFHPLFADVLIGTASAPGIYKDSVGITVTF